MADEKIVEIVGEEDTVQTENNSESLVLKAKDKFSRYGKKVGIIAAGIGIGVLGFILGSKTEESHMDYIDTTIDDDSTEYNSEE